MPEQQITYNLETTLSAPDGITLSAIHVSIHIEPKDAGCLIYGWLQDGSMGCIEIQGPGGKFELPFAKPKIFVKYLKGLKNIKILTRGWTDPRQ